MRIKIVILIILIIAAVIIATIVGLIFFKTSSLGPAPTELDECTVLHENAGDVINVVMMGSSREVAQNYIDFILESEPFNLYDDLFNFYYVGGYKPDCKLYQGIAMLCYSREIVKISGSCPNDQIVILSNEFGRSIRSSNYLNVMSINTKHPKSVFLHEFGHSFVNLAEEYVPAKIPRNSAGNCVEDCVDFNGRNDGCYLGCSLNSYSRSIENGVMRTLSSSEFGSFNEWVIQNKVTELTESPSRLTGSAIFTEGECKEQKYYMIEGLYSGGKVEIVKAEIETGCLGKNGVGELEYSLLTDKGIELFVGEFRPDIIFTDSPGDNLRGEELLEGQEIVGEIFDNDGPFYIKVPVLDKASRFEIKDSGGSLLSDIDLEKAIYGLISKLGNNTWRVYANDTSGNVNSESVTFYVDLQDEFSKIDEENIALSPSRISFETYPKEFDLLVISDKANEWEIEVINLGEADLVIDVELEGVTDVVDLSTDRLVLKSGEKMKINMSIPGLESGIHVGKIVFYADDLEKEIPILINVETTPVLFNASIKVKETYKNIFSDQDLKAEMLLVQLGPPAEVDVNVDYTIKDFEGNIIYRENETINVSGSTKINKEFSTLELNEGEYVLGVELKYPGGYISITDIFSFPKKIVKSFLITVILFVLAIVVILVVVFLNYGKRKRIIGLSKFK